MITPPRDPAFAALEIEELTKRAEAAEAKIAHVEKLLADSDEVERFDPSPIDRIWINCVREALESA